MRTLDQVVSSLPPAQRAKIAARASQLLNEEKALRQLRVARELTQQSMAKLMGVGQADISKIENRADMLLSTLRSYVEAMGGSLRMVVEFPDGRAVLTSLAEKDAVASAKPNRRSARKPAAPGAIERSLGKAKRVVDKRPRE